MPVIGLTVALAVAPSETTVSENCPAARVANNAETAGLALVIVKSNGFSLPLAALPHKAK